MKKNQEQQQPMQSTADEQSPPVEQGQKTTAQTDGFRYDYDDSSDV
ncbi:hypothetical protein [Halalkalibacter alkaliphilus]|uniref:Uncharacterized protein n=2 Tax=Halalkalibacter TaxID=2893056 RepID=A0A9X2CV66_9BACI|nr:hypothetical protein [Halalkalibacter alkaliphilus]MCL7748607.1 hypothetical protein [Halalkalibacter alkaliphilus]